MFWQCPDVALMLQPHGCSGGCPGELEAFQGQWSGSGLAPVLQGVLHFLTTHV